jgi:transposase
MLEWFIDSTLCAASVTSPSCCSLTCATGWPHDHLAWFILDVVDELDPDPFYRPYRADGHGHPAYDPKLLLGVLLYASAIGVRSSRQIAQRCTEDLAFRCWPPTRPPTT